MAKDKMWGRILCCLGRHSVACRREVVRLSYANMMMVLHFDLATEVSGVPEMMTVLYHRCSRCGEILHMTNDGDIHGRGTYRPPYAPVPSQ